MEESEFRLSPHALEAIGTRTARVMSAVALETPDRVPFVPSMNNFYALHYGVTIKAAMEDNKVLIPVMQRYLADYDPDLVWSTGAFFPIQPMETVGYTNARWPGAYYGLPDDTPYQYIDSQHLADDEYESFIADPGSFLLNKVLPGKFARLGGLSSIDFYAAAGQGIYGLAQFGGPQVKEALLTLIEAGEETQAGLGNAIATSMSVMQAGYPLYGDCIGVAAFDDFADNVRGLLATCMDIINDADLVDAAVNRWAEVTIPSAVLMAKTTRQEFAFIPLHCGTEDFMSLANYRAHYWPTLKALIEAYVAADITPLVFCEGKYNSRLETIADVPRGKVAYFFQDVDLARAKEVLGDVACIAGGMPSTLLATGPNNTPERIRAHVAHVLEECAPGGGFIMSNTQALDCVDPQLMHAWRDAVDEFGTY